VWTECSIFEC